jgi:hypothetical protein
MEPEGSLPCSRESAVFSLLISFCFNFQISQQLNIGGKDKILHTFNRDCVGYKFDFENTVQISQNLYIYIYIYFFFVFEAKIS